MCVAYKTTDGQTLKDFPVTLEELAKCSPIYEEIEGYEGDLSACKTFEELPEKAQAYVKRLEAVSYTHLDVYQRQEKELGWKAEKTLDEMCRDAWNFRKLREAEK